MARVQIKPSPNCFRLIVLFFETTPEIDQIEAALDGLPAPIMIHFAKCDAHSARAAMWTRNPTGRLPTGRLALEYAGDELDFTAACALAEALGGEAHWCLGRSPIPHPLTGAGDLAHTFSGTLSGTLSGTFSGTFSGTLQICCFERAGGLSNEELEHIWFEEHAPVAIETQNNVGYRQNLVLHSSHTALDGIVEELFPIEAADSLNHFFADGDDVEKMMLHINRLTESSERVLDLDKSSVIHMTEQCLR